MPRISDTDLDVFPLCLGGNVFGWTADESASFSVLDAYVSAGGNFIDTADLYAGSESERIIGRWLRQSGRRDQVVIATKVGMAEWRPGLAPENVRAGCAESLERLGIEQIDLYYAHRDDPETAVETIAEGFAGLIEAGHVRHWAVSNFTAERLASLLSAAQEHGLPEPVALQPHYNLVERGEYEGPLQDLCAQHGLACVPYFGLARGFLTGKYRPGGGEIDSPRARGAAKYLDAPNGPPVLEALDDIAAAHGVPHAAVALAWLAAQPTVVAPIASARTTEQLDGLLAVADLELTDAELSELDAASAQPV